MTWLGPSGVTCTSREQAARKVSAALSDAVISAVSSARCCDVGSAAAAISSTGHSVRPGAAAPGLTEWPVDEIAAAAEPTSQQRALLTALITASDKAAETFRAACSRDVHVTPLGPSHVIESQPATQPHAAQH